LSEKDKENEESVGKHFLSKALGIVLLLWVLWPLILAFIAPRLADFSKSIMPLLIGDAPLVSKFVSSVPLNFEKMGQFGDLFGGINALFTAAAFTAVW
jgi:hypothetical protein